MTGNLLAQARADMQKIVQSGGFQDDIVLSTADGSIEVAVQGLASGIHVAFDSEGNSVDSNKAHVSIPEQTLISLGYPVRNASGRVSLKNHKVKVKDAVGNDQNFVINSAQPNETTGLLICILGRSKS